MTKGIKKFNKAHNKDWVDASSSGTNIFDLNETSIENKS